MKTLKLIFKCVKDLEMPFKFNILTEKYYNTLEGQYYNTKSMLDVILEEFEKEMPLTLDQEKLKNKVLKKLEKYNE